MEETPTHNFNETSYSENETNANISNSPTPESNTTTNYQELISNLNNPEKVQEATKKEVNAKETYIKFRQYYYQVSHDDYYAAKAKLDQNVELKKSLRLEMQKFEPLKDKPTLTNEETDEVRRIETLIEDQNKVPEKEKIITEKMNQIEEQLKELKILVKGSFE